MQFPAKKELQEAYTGKMSMEERKQLTDHFVAGRLTLEEVAMQFVIKEESQEEWEKYVNALMVLSELAKQRQNIS